MKSLPFYPNNSQIPQSSAPEYKRVIIQNSKTKEILKQDIEKSILEIIDKYLKEETHESQIQKNYHTIKDGVDKATQKIFKKSLKQNIHKAHSPHPDVSFNETSSDSYDSLFNQTSDKPNSHHSHTTNNFQFKVPFLGITVDSQEILDITKTVFINLLMKKLQDPEFLMRILNSEGGHKLQKLIATLFGNSNK